MPLRARPKREFICDRDGGLSMGEVRVLPIAVTGIRLADAITTFLATIGPANTRRGYAAALNRLRGIRRQPEVTVFDGPALWRHPLLSG